MSKRRPSGDGMVRKREDGRWEGRIVIGHKENGAPIFRYIYASTQKELTAKLRQNINAYQGVDLTEESKMTLSEWLDRWLEQMASVLRPSTLDHYRNDLEHHVKPYLGQKRLTQITAADLRKLYDTLKQRGRLRPRPGQSRGLSTTTFHGVHTTLHAALNKAVEEKLIFCNPSDGCKLPSAKPREMQVLTPEEIQRLLIQAREDDCYELLLLELSTGIRRGEICALKWDDLNFKTEALKVERQVHRVKGELVVSQPKTKASNRSVVLPAPVLTVLKSYKKTVHSQWMFPSPVKEDSPQDPTAVRKKLSIILERADCKHIRFHDLRHTFATASLEHDMDVKTLSTIIGHVSSSTTLNIYTHVTDEMQRTAAAKIDLGIRRKPPKAETEVAPRKPAPSTFQPHKGKRRKPGTGCISQINDHLWEGRYSPIWPDGKKHAHNVYAKTREECEQLLAELIEQMNTEITAEKARLRQKEKSG